MRAVEFENQLKDVMERLSRPLFFVAGAPKSGTTWLQLMLDGHPEIYCAGEGHFTDWIGKPFLGLVKEYNKRMKLNNDFIYRDNSYYRGFSDNEYQFLTALIVRFVLAQHEVKPTAKWIGDKTPIYAHGLDYLVQVFPEARVVGIVRDPRDAAVSFINQQFRIGRDPTFEVGSQSYVTFVENFARNWSTSLTKMRDLGAKHPGRYAEICYEALHKDPANIRPALELLGVDCSPASIEACALAGDFTRYAGGRERGESDEGSFFRKGVVGDWRDSLDQDSVTCLESMAGKEMREAGYL